MTPEQFSYWLQGFFELETSVALTKREQIIKDHLKEVFHKITPDRNIAAPNYIHQPQGTCTCGTPAVCMRHVLRNYQGGVVC